MAAKFEVFVYEDHSKLSTLYWLPKLHKRPYKSRFIANSSSCTTSELSILLTSCLNAIKYHVIKYCTTVYERKGKKPGEILYTTFPYTPERPKWYKLWSCQKMCDALHYLLDNIFIRVGSKLNRQVVGIPVGTNCASLVADLFCFVMGETSCCLCQTIIKLILLKLLTPPPDISMTCLILIILILNKL